MNTCSHAPPAPPDDAAAAAARKRAARPAPIAAYLLRILYLAFVFADMSASSDQVGVGLYLVPIEQRGFLIKGATAYCHIVSSLASSATQVWSLAALQSALDKSESMMCWWKSRAET